MSRSSLITLLMVGTVFACAPFPPPAPLDGKVEIIAVAGAEVIEIVGTYEPANGSTGGGGSLVVNRTQGEPARHLEDGSPLDMGPNNSGLLDYQAEHGQSYTYTGWVRDTWCCGPPVTSEPATISASLVDTWRENTPITSPSSERSYGFGESMATWDRWLVIGESGECAYGTDDGSEDTAWGRAQPRGRVYVYERAGSGFVLRETFSNSDTHLCDGFGYSVTIDDGWIAVGAPFFANESYSLPLEEQKSGIHLFRLDGDDWRPEQVLRWKPTHTDAQNAGYGNHFWHFLPEVSAMGTDVTLSNGVLVFGGQTISREEQPQNVTLQWIKTARLTGETWTLDRYSRARGFEARRPHYDQLTLHLEDGFLFEATPWYLDEKHRLDGFEVRRDRNPGWSTTFVPKPFEDDLRDLGWTQVDSLDHPIGLAFDVSGDTLAVGAFQRNPIDHEDLEEAAARCAAMSRYDPIVLLYDLNDGSPTFREIIQIEIPAQIEQSPLQMGLVLTETQLAFTMPIGAFAGNIPIPMAQRLAFGGRPGGSMIALFSKEGTAWQEDTLFRTLHTTRDFHGPIAVVDNEVLGATQDGLVTRFVPPNHD